MYKLISNKRLITSLYYKGSIHGWNARDFHSRCDKRGPTISLFKIKDGDCIGGYTSASWTADDKYVNDKEAFLFNLSSFRYFPSKLTGTEIYHSKTFGPCFNGSHASELCAF